MTDQSGSGLQQAIIFSIDSSIHILSIDPLSVQAIICRKRVTANPEGAPWGDIFKLFCLKRYSNKTNNNEIRLNTVKNTVKHLHLNTVKKQTFLLINSMKSLCRRGLKPVLLLKCNALNITSYYYLKGLLPDWVIGKKNITTNPIRNRSYYSITAFKVIWYCSCVLCHPDCSCMRFSWFSNHPRTYRSFTLLHNSNNYHHYIIYRDPQQKENSRVLLWNICFLTHFQNIASWQTPNFI